jgi:hypothetical protein
MCAENASLRRREYNEERPHSAIGNKAPIELVRGTARSLSLRDLARDADTDHSPAAPCVGPFGKRRSARIMGS